MCPDHTRMYQYVAPPDFSRVTKRRNRNADYHQTISLLVQPERAFRLVASVRMILGSIGMIRVERNHQLMLPAAITSGDGSRPSRAPFRFSMPFSQHPATGPLRSGPLAIILFSRIFEQSEHSFAKLWQSKDA